MTIYRRAQQAERGRRRRENMNEPTREEIIVFADEANRRMDDPDPRFAAAADRMKLRKTDPKNNDDDYEFVRVIWDAAQKRLQKD
jgi:hypothetical protein